MNILNAAVIVLALVVPALHAQAPPDIKGWHGAEWGMTVEQVTAAAQLGPLRVKPPTPHFLGTSYEAGTIAIGRMTATVTFSFRDGEGLTNIGLTFGDEPFAPLRDELKARYGEPTSESHERGFIAIEEAKWILSSTSITCQRWEPTSRNRTASLILSYSKHAAPVL
jgi:hypothetical protein